ncbi:MAG TPA: nitroreductase family protein, partial [Chitinophagaceae bacterium]|nr:nitroreductase family protein [Chitinophagaceae bacterium]
MPDKKEINGYPFISYSKKELSTFEIVDSTKSFYQFMNTRRSIREFSNRAIEKEVITNIILTASTAPSGAHKQPWTFCVISNPAIKKKIRIAAEEEEKKSYNERMSDEWLKDLAPLGTDWQKPF